MLAATIASCGGEFPKVIIGYVKKCFFCVSYSRSMAIPNYNIMNKRRKVFLIYSHAIQNYIAFCPVLRVISCAIALH